MGQQKLININKEYYTLFCGSKNEKINNEKDTNIKIYEENLNDIIWTHKIYAILFDKKDQIYI